MDQKHEQKVGRPKVHYEAGLILTEYEKNFPAKIMQKNLESESINFIQSRMDHILNLIDSSLSYDQHSFKVQSKGIKSQILSGSVRFQEFSYYVKNHITNKVIINGHK